jgi:hypothetical protein
VSKGGLSHERDEVSSGTGRETHSGLSVPPPGTTPPTAHDSTNGTASNHASPKRDSQALQGPEGKPKGDVIREIEREKGVGLTQLRRKHGYHRREKG